MEKHLIKRSEFVFFYHKNGKVLDMEAIFSGDISYIDSQQMLAFPVLYGKEIVITEEEFDIIKAIPTGHWIDIESIAKNDTVFIEKFSALGVILTTSNSTIDLSNLKHEEILNRSKWNIYSAFFHFLTKWRDIDVDLVTDDYEGNENMDLYHVGMDNIMDRNGLPPSHFHEVNAISKVTLPVIDKSEDPYYNTVLKRRTSRLFNPDQNISLEKLATILYYTFGCHGIYEMHESLKMIHKTVPSGGSLHPTEAYILSLNVDSLVSGIYHYNVEFHRLDLVKQYNVDEAKEMANKFVAGQNYVKDSNLLVIMTSRYYRNFWKYQQHTLAYKVTLFDAAHLSQMFYLNCAKEGLGAFVTGAVNTSLIEEELSLDGFVEGTTLVVGCGIGFDDGRENLLQPTFEKHVIENG